MRKESRGFHSKLCWYNETLLQPCNPQGEFLAEPTANLIAVYPGSFDPITYGHLDLIARGSRLVDRLIVAILNNEAKQPLFSVEERVAMLEEVIKPFPNVEIGTFGGLTVAYATERGANVIFRGIRAIS